MIALGYMRKPDQQQVGYVKYSYYGMCIDKAITALMNTVASSKRRRAMVDHERLLLK